MARRHEGNGPQERYSPPSKESRSLSKCLEEDQDSLTAERVIEITTLLYNSDCLRSTMQTLSTATAIQQGSTQIHKVQTKHQKGGKSTEWSNQDKTSVLLCSKACSPQIAVSGQGCYLSQVWKERTLQKVLQEQNR